MIIAVAFLVLIFICNINSWAISFVSDLPFGLAFICNNDGNTEKSI